MAANPNDWPTWLLGPKPSSNTSTVSQPSSGMSAQTPKPTGSMPQSTPSYSTPSTPSYSSPSSTATATKPPSSQSDGSGGIKLTKMGPNGEYTFTVVNEDWAKFYENQGAARVGSMPQQTVYTPPTNYGVDSQGKPLTEQQWLGSGGLLGLSGKNELGAYKTLDGRYLDTSNMTPQQVQAATLWDEVKAGKRSADSAAAVLKGMGVDAYGNPVSGLYQGNNVYYASGYNPSVSALAPMSAQATKTAGPSPVGATNTGSMPSSATSSGLTPSQKSAQDYIVKSGQWGTLDNYVQNNINRYLSGEISYDRLAADAQRVGYAIPPQSSMQSGGNVTPSGGSIPNQAAQMQPDFRAIAEAEAARDLAGKQRVAGQQIAGITNAFNRSNQILQGNRTLEDASINRTLNPFSGRTSYAKGLTARERTLADESAQGNFNTAIQGIQQGLADDQNTAAQWIMARASELENQAQQRAMQEAQLTGVYNGSPTMAARQQALDQAQREWENRFAYGQATGTFNNGQKTLAAVQQEWENMFREQQFEESKAARLWEQAFNEKSFTQKMKEAAADRGLQWANLSQRDKEFIADQEFREKQFKLDQDKFNASQSGSTLTAKDSTNNYNMIFDDLQSDGVDKNTARQLLNANRNFLSDSDYNRLNNWINDNL